MTDPFEPSTLKCSGAKHIVVVTSPQASLPIDNHVPKLQNKVEQKDFHSIRKKIHMLALCSDVVAVAVWLQNVHLLNNLCMIIP
jgi:hypothetical protein